MVILFFLVPVSFSEDLAEVLWRRLTPTNKTKVSWMGYIRNILFRIVKFEIHHSKSLMELMITCRNLALDFKMFAVHPFTRFYECLELDSCSLFKRNHHRILTAPITHLQVTWFKMGHSTSRAIWKRNFLFQIHVHKEYRVNITFKQIHLHSPHGICKSHNLVVQSTTDTRITQHVFCARYAIFNVYPSFNQVQLHVRIISGMLIKVDSLLSVITQGVIENLQLHLGNIQLIDIKSIVKIKLVVDTYRITTQKYQRAVVAYMPNATSKSSYTLIHDGPGLKSPKQYPNHKNIYFVSSFQCVVQIITESSDGDNIKYIGVDVHRQVQYLNETISHSIIRLTGIKMSVFHIYSPESTNINITVSDLTYKGIASP